VIVVEAVAQPQEQAGAQRGVEFPVTRKDSHERSIEQVEGGLSR
jgi:hypothetical protein